MTNTVTTTQAPKPLRRIDLNIKPYMRSDNRISTWQIVNTTAPLAFCCIAIAKVTEEPTTTSIILTPIFSP